MLVDDAHRAAVPGEFQGRGEAGRPGADHQDRKILSRRRHRTARNETMPARAAPDARVSAPVPATPRSSGPPRYSVTGGAGSSRPRNASAATKPRLVEPVSSVSAEIAICVGSGGSSPNDSR